MFRRNSFSQFAKKTFGGILALQVKQKELVCLIYSPLTDCKDGCCCLRVFAVAGDLAKLNYNDQIQSTYLFPSWLW